MTPSKPYVVGIAGGSGSGKTTFLKSLMDQLPRGSAALLTQDNYYLPIEKQQLDPNGETNFDLPTSVDKDHFVSDLKQLIQGQIISKKEYTFNNDSAVARTISIRPAPLIITEGLFIFHYKEINELLDYRVYIDANEAVRLWRRIERDDRERGYGEKIVRYQWENHVIPAEVRYLHPFKESADLIIDNTKSFDKELAFLSSKLKTRLTVP
jgi:uridine kinase